MTLSIYFYFFPFKSDSFFDSRRNDCIKRQTYGDTCKYDDECDQGLVCSSRGEVKNVCLLDYTHFCSQDNECANYLKCIKGVCSCQVLCALLIRI
jgi:hypothetical protein